MRPPTDVNDKQAWRHAARTTRAELDLASWSAELVEVLRAWPAYQAATTVATYLAFGHEADLDALLSDAKRFAAPRTGLPGKILRFHEVTGMLERHAFGMLEPPPSAARVAEDEIDLVLVPGLAFDRYGTRLGRGGGFYDAWLARLAPGTPLVGIAHPRLVVARLPMEAHDVTLTHLLLPGGVQKVEGS